MIAIKKSNKNHKKARQQKNCQKMDKNG